MRNFLPVKSDVFIGVKVEVKRDDFKTLLGVVSNPTVYTLQWLTFPSPQP